MNYKLILKSLFILILFFCVLSGCNRNKNEQNNIENNSISDSREENKHDINKTYSNEAFRNVIVEKSGEKFYKVSGEARVFEATLNYVIEDGHNELKKGYTTASTGAPNRGKFNFTFEVEKENPHLTLTLILFESSAKDGKPLHELFIPLN